MLLPPPLPLQARSLIFPAAVNFSVVPPTPMTALSEDSYSACSGPFDPWPLPSGFDPAAPDAP